jgi:hypothetical protein
MNGLPSTPQIRQRSFSLTVHDQTPTDAVRSVEARVSRYPDGELCVTYSIAGDLSRLRIPPPRPKGVAERLWQHTCCELFVQRRGVAGYHELNFAPSGEWAGYRFQAYSEAQSVLDHSLDPHLQVRTSAVQLELEAAIRLERLAPEHARDALALSVAAVIEERDGRLSYWAVAHPRGKPDFHHHDAFAVRLDEIRH